MSVHGLTLGFLSLCFPPLHLSQALGIRGLSLPAFVPLEVSSYLQVRRLRS